MNPWDNAKTPYQKFAAYYLKRYNNAYYQASTPTMVSAFFKTHGRAISNIVNQAPSWEIAAKALDLYASDRNKAGCAWSVRTQEQHCADYIGEAISSGK